MSTNRNAGMTPGARELPLKHLTVRVPWHDGLWAGTFCNTPRENTCCRVLKNIQKNKDDSGEVASAGSAWNGANEEQWRTCMTERGGFMSPHPITRHAKHPYARPDSAHAHVLSTPVVHPAHSAGCIPFRWMLREFVEGNPAAGIDSIAETWRLGYRAEREPLLQDKRGRQFGEEYVEHGVNQRILLDTFFSAVRPEESLCFFYAKKTPLSEDGRRVIVGVGRVLAVDPSIEYRYSVKNPDLPCYVWERNVSHSIRPTGIDGFLLPYQAILDEAATKGRIDPEDFVAFAPEEEFEAFSYSSEHLDHDGAIASLLACAGVVRKIANVLPGKWDQTLDWIDLQLNRLWTMRGPCPGFGSALVAMGLAHGNLIAHEIAAAQAESGQEWNRDPWELFEQVVRDPRKLPNAVAAAEIGPTYRQVWQAMSSSRRSLLKLLSRMTLSADQATRWFHAEDRSDARFEIDDETLLANPYLICELDEARDAVRAEAVDRGIFPDPVVASKHPLPVPSRMDDAIDPRRVRAFLVDELKRAASQGSTLLPTDEALSRVRARELRPACPLRNDMIPVVEKHFLPLIQKVPFGSGGDALQLAFYRETGNVMRTTIERRILGRRHPGTHDWARCVEMELGRFDPRDDPDEALARKEKAAVLEELFRSRASVLVGSAGTGKTTLVKMLCDLPEVDSGGVLLLAPTGKARVRLESKTDRRGRGFTVAGFLLRNGRYDPETGKHRIGVAAEKCGAYKTVIIDECSMLTEDQLASILDALSGVERLVLVGDPYQLPPIGAGRPFLDIVRRLAPKNVETLFPKVGPGYGELTIPRRQGGRDRDDLLLARWFSGRPVDAGADEIWDRIARSPSPFVRAVEWKAGDDLQEKLFTVLAEELKLAGPDDANGFEQSIGGSLFRDAVYFWAAKPGSDGAASKVECWQILSPVHAGLHGVDSINHVTQARFRGRVLEWATESRPWLRKIPPPMGPQGILYGDKVINITNQTREHVWPEMKEAPYVANGDIGVIVGQFKGKESKLDEARHLEVEMQAWPGHKIKFFSNEFSEEDGRPPLELAYALTVHKAQGSEFRLTLVIVPNPCWVLSREMLYTALTRQTDRIVLFHQGPLRDLRAYSSELKSNIATRMTNLFSPPDMVTVPEGSGHRFLEAGLVHRTRRNDLVRSKSEVIVADTLLAVGVRDYEYETPLQGRDGTIRLPDFTIRDAETGDIVFWEHLGMMNDRGYSERWKSKVQWYRDNGILPRDEGGGPNGTLVVTKDDEHGGIDSAEIERIAREALHR